MAVYVVAIFKIVTFRWQIKFDSWEIPLAIYNYSSTSNNINSISSFNAHLILFRGKDLSFDENFGPWLQAVVSLI